MRKHIEQVESLYGDIRGIRHDMANHILTLEKLYEGDKKEEAKAYGEELKKALAQTAESIIQYNADIKCVCIGIRRIKKITAETDSLPLRFALPFL